MYRVGTPKALQLIPFLSGRRYIGFDGAWGHLMDSRYGTFPEWDVTEQGQGITLSDERSSIITIVFMSHLAVQERDFFSRSPLHLVCSVHSPGQLGVIRDICSSESANVNVLDSMRRTPLHHALSPSNLKYYSSFPDCDKHLIELINLLLELGANVNALDRDNVSPLHLALDFHSSGFARNLKVLPVILDLLKLWNADMNKIVGVNSFRAGKGCLFRSFVPPLHLACRMDGVGSLTAIKFLLDASPTRGNVNCVDSIGRTPLHAAIMSLCRIPRPTRFVRDTIFSTENSFVLEKMLILLNARADVNLVDVDGMSPLLTAIKFCNYETVADIIKTLIYWGADATTENSENFRTPLHLVCQHLDHSLRELLPYFLRAGASLHVTDYLLHTPFHSALENQCCSINTLECLVDAGANATALDKRKNNCIHIVCSNPRQKNVGNIAKFLTSKGCNLNAVNWYGNTPLMQLLQSDYEAESVRELVLLGADCRVVNRDCISALHIVLGYLAPSKVEVVKSLVQGGADVNARDISLRTPLFYAVRDETAIDGEVVLILLQAGASPNLADELGISPLHLVCSYGNHHLAKMLISFGASVNQPDAEGNSPLHEAARAYNGDPFLTCQVLVDAGANVTAVNHTGRTPVLMIVNSFASFSYRFLLGRLVQLIHDGEYSLTDDEKNHIRASRRLSGFFDDSLACVELLASCRLGNTSITLSRFLMAPPAEASRYLRNPLVLEDLSRIAENTTSFRPYSQTVKNKTMACKQFLDLFKCSALSVQMIFPDPKLPLIVTEEIASYLNEFEMKLLNTAVFGESG